MGEAELKQVRTDLAVGIGFPCGFPYLPWQTAMALVKTAHAAPLLGVPLNIHIVAGSSLVTIARDRILDQFLASPNEKFLFWIDADLVWEPEDFFRILALTKTGVFELSALALGSRAFGATL